MLTSMIFVACPLAIELKLLLQCLSRDGHSVRDVVIDRTKVYECDSLGWVLAQGGHGKTQFAIQSLHVIHHYPAIRAMICTGACGALSSELKIGDVIAATKTIEHDFKERFIPQPLPEFAADTNLLTAVRKGGHPIIEGIVASGDEDIVHGDRGRELIDATQAIAVAWEGAGGARAAKFKNLPYLELRGVTDAADSTAVSDFKKNLPIAMSSIYEVLKKAFASNTLS